MISEITVHPKASNKKAYFVFYALLALSVATVVVYILLKQYKGIVGMGIIGLFTATILIYTKYISVEFYYDVTFDYNKNPIFVVRQKTGKRETTLARIDLFNIVKIERETRKERKAHIAEKGYVKYNYTPSISPAEVLRITVSGHYEKAEMVIEGTDEFAQLLRDYAKEAKEKHSEEEDEY